ncbi:hypothetical protein CK203_074686 [Vitis vinifera]|uniref:Reverse transcriptase domain-containing protein n=1 Tax=Vitis vinifera TaxID=29760 RepID=A0A438DW95_VITVI|nr:hypothetical protein CK203_074686 [Vitis vinifera]
MSQMSLGVVRSLGVGRFLDWGVLNVRGAAGGVLVFWDKRVLELVGMEGGPFTWSGGLNNQAMFRLDRFLVSEDWEGHFKGACSVLFLGLCPTTSYSIGWGGVGVNKKLALDKVIFWDGQESFAPYHWRNWKLERRRNCLSKIKVDGVWLTEEQEIKGSVVRAFKDQLTDPGGWHTSMEGLDFNRIGDEDAARLEEVFSEEEVFQALSDLNGDKAPVLANKLKKVVGKVVSSAQNAFVEGRQILDAALIANEAIDSLLKRNESGVLCKLDLEKAYDHINWNFLLFVLQSMGFGRSGPGDLLVLLYSNVFSLGQWHSGRLFQQFKGVASGGPPIPLSFCDRNGGLSRLIHRAVGEGSYQVVESMEGVGMGLWSLICSISGLRINLDKSEILPVGRVENLETLALEAGCKVGRLPSSYLGIPWGRTTSLWLFGMGWKRDSETTGLVEETIISKRERITLIEYIVKYAHILDVFTSNAKSGGLGRRVLDSWERKGFGSPRFSKPFNDWEVEEVERLLLTIPRCKAYSSYGR